MKKIGDRIKYLRKDILKLTQQEFANKLFMSTSNISRYEKNEHEFSERMINLICKEFNINKNWLVNGIGDIVSEKSSENIDLIAEEFALDEKSKIVLENFLNLTDADRSSLITLLEKLTTPKKDTITLPFYDILVNAKDNVKEDICDIISLPFYDFPVSAGLGNPFNDYTDAVKKDFKLNNITKCASFTLRVTGDSMEPTIKNGQIIFVKSMPQIEFGEIGLFSYNNESFCKRLISENNKVILRSDNEMYEDIVLTENDNVITFGKVLV